MRGLIAILAALMTIAVAHAAGGDGWVSSGGELFRDAKNPWFVRNTQEIRWCVEVDEATVSQPSSLIIGLIEEAFTYWGEEFDRVRRVSPMGINLQLATQKPVRTDCATGTADLRFKIGHGTLTAEEIAFLREPRRFIGVSVRTEYDEINLKGRGFIYISSDLGPNAYDNPGSLIDRAWRFPGLLQYAILHELGHVYGLTHSAAGLMSEVFFDQLLNKAIYEFFLDSVYEGFFVPSGSLRLCNEFLSGSAKAWFGIPMDASCITVNHDGAPITVGYTDKDGNFRDRAGTLTMKLDLFDSRDRPSVYLHLNPKQKVFTEKEAGFRSFMVGAKFVDFGADAVYTPASSNIPKAVRLRVTSGSLQLLGQHSGKLLIPFNYSSLIGAKMSLPPILD